jgi:RNA polymerase sigma factor (sigma-70 family)
LADDLALAELVDRAVGGEQQAWNKLVERYTRLVWSICRRYRLPTADIQDVSQTVWLRLVEQLSDLRKAEALPGWLAVTTQRECLRVSTMAARQRATLGRRIDLEQYDVADEDAVVGEALLEDERAMVLRAAFAELPERCRRLLNLLLRDPPASYKEISAELAVPMGSIGPSRGRCLEVLRRIPEVAALMGDADGAEGGDGRVVPSVER